MHICKVNIILFHCCRRQRSGVTREYVSGTLIHTTCVHVDVGACACVLHYITHWMLFFLDDFLYPEHQISHTHLHVRNTCTCTYYPIHKLHVKFLLHPVMFMGCV